MEWVKKMAECKIDEELGGFRIGRGCVGQIFSMKMVVGKEYSRKEIFMQHS